MPRGYTPQKNAGHPGSRYKSKIFLVSSVAFACVHICRHTDEEIEDPSIETPRGLGHFQMRVPKHHISYYIPRDPSIQIIQIILTLGHGVCKYYLHWAIWIPSALLGLPKHVHKYLETPMTVGDERKRIPTCRRLSLHTVRAIASKLL